MEASSAYGPESRKGLAYDARVYSSACRSSYIRGVNIVAASQAIPKTSSKQQTPIRELAPTSRRPNRLSRPQNAYTHTFLALEYTENYVFVQQQ